MSSNKIVNKYFYDGFHKTSTNYKKIINANNFTYALIVPTLDKIFNTKNKLKVLDYGCGVGTTSLYVASKNNYVYGCDISPKAVKIAQDSAKNTNLESTTMFFDSEDTGKIIQDNSIDVVLCLEVIEHVEDQQKLIVLLRSKLKKGGVILLSTPSINAPLYKLNLLKDFDKRVGHFRRYSINDLKELFHKNKFSVLSSEEKEGIIRNSLFTLKPLGFILRFIKWKISSVVTFFDNVSVMLFGGSDIVILAQKI